MIFEIWETNEGDAGLVPANHDQKDLAFGEDRKLIESFEAVTWAEAMQHYYDRYNYGTYRPICERATLPYDAEEGR